MAVRDKVRTLRAFPVVCVWLFHALAFAAPTRVVFEPSTNQVAIFDFLEVRLDIGKPDASNPFKELQVEGKFGHAGEPEAKVEGFCDSDQGRVYRIRFMPTKAGAHSYSIRVQQEEFQTNYTGQFVAVDQRRPGTVGVDPNHPSHFIWRGTGEHFFWNGTTTYWLLGWDDENIRKNIDRLARLRVNRLRVLLNGRVKSGRDWYENVFPTDRFKMILNPWIAQRPTSIENPGFNTGFFNIPHWQKFERLLAYARERDIVISVIFFVDGNKRGMDPFGKSRAGGEDEQLYYRYAVARFGAFANVMWDLSNEYRFIRSDDWVNTMGARLMGWDVYHHLASVHGYSDFHFRASPWADFAMYQQWDESGGHQFMLQMRAEQAKSSRIIPQVNEEYGYEDHYPAAWGGGKKAPARSADNRRRIAWGIYMAGCYQTTGERADRATGSPPDSGGGWVNGRGDETMTMLEGYARIREFFANFNWWKTEPHDELVTNGSMCLAEPGKLYAVYLPHGGETVLTLPGGKYASRQFDPLDGKWNALPGISGTEWKSPVVAGARDAAFLITRLEQ